MKVLQKWYDVNLDDAGRERCLAEAADEGWADDLRAQVARLRLTPELRPGTLDENRSQLSVFMLSSFVIVLREGFEAFLIVARAWGHFAGPVAQVATAHA